MYWGFEFCRYVLCNFSILIYFKGTLEKFNSWQQAKLKFIILFNFSGLCLDSLGSSCLPKKTKLETHPITVYVNSTPYCTSIELEHHRGPCKCDCHLSPSSCNNRQKFLPETCACQCLPILTPEKIACVNSTHHTWNSEEKRWKTEFWTIYWGFSKGW